MFDVYEEECFSKKNVYKWTKFYKEGQNTIEDEDRQGRPTMASTPEMEDSVNVLILAVRKVTIEYISEQVGIFVSTAHEIMHGDLTSSEVSCHLGFTRIRQSLILKQE